MTPRVFDHEENRMLAEQMRKDANKAYQKSDKYKAYQKAYQKAYADTVVLPRILRRLRSDEERKTG